MRVHAIQTGTVAVKQSHRQGVGTGVARVLRILCDPEWTEPLPVYAWVIEHPEGLIVVDTGENARAAQAGYYPSWHPYFRWCVRIAIGPDDEIGPQMRARGLSPDDVRWVVLTHLHPDHAGGLHHFRRAEFVVDRREHVAATARFARLKGYFPARWPEWFAPRLVDFSPRPWGAFQQSLALTRAEDVVLVSDPGHSPGHLCVALQEPDHDLLFAGDATFNQQLMREGRIDGLAFHEREVRESLATMARHAALRPTVLLPSHDADAATRLENRTVVPPPAP